MFFQTPVDVFARDKKLVYQCRRVPMRRIFNAAGSDVMRHEVGLFSCSSQQWEPPQDGAVEERQEILILTSVADLAPLIGEWDDLAASASEPNAFFESWFLLPALRNGVIKEPFFVCVVQRTQYFKVAPPVRCWDGFFPLSPGRHFHHVRCPILKSLEHRHGFCLTPLLREGYELETLQEFLRWFPHAPGSPELLYLPTMPTQGRLFTALCEALNENHLTYVQGEHYARAMMRRSTVDSRETFCPDLGGKRRREFRRLARRLGESGVLEMASLFSMNDLALWGEQFLQLEVSGWKGARKTALASCSEDAKFFQEMISGAATRERLMLLRFSLGERVIAMKCNLLAPPGAFAFKIAYDESYAKYCPGVLLELEHMRRFNNSDNNGVEWIDSCAVSDHFMANRLWRERRSFCDFVIAESVQGRILVRMLPVLREARRLGLAIARYRL